MDYSDIKKVVHEIGADRVNKYLNTKRWTILAVAPGRDEDGEAYCLYSLGWHGPLNPSYPEEDHSEFPEGLDPYGDEGEDGL